MKIIVAEVKSHHFTAFITLFVGISFVFERYLLISPALIGPVALLSWVPGPLTPIQVWGTLFILGSLGILFAPTPFIRAIFLIGGVGSWALFASTSLYASFFGPSSASTGSLLGIVLMGLVFRFLIAIRDVVKDFTTRKSRATMDA